MEVPSQDLSPSSHSPDDEKPKKRQRMSVVCLNCKARKIKCDKKRPSCTNCLKCNVGHLCEYEPPHWVSRVTTSKGTPIVALKEAEARLKKEAAYVAPIPGSTMDANGVDGTGSVYEEIRKLRTHLSMLEESVGISPSTPSLDTPQSISGTALDDSNEDVIDFYESFNSLVVKRSAMEEFKPLCSTAHLRKDIYSIIMTGYFTLCGKVYKAKFGDVRRRPGNKKTRLDASLTEFLFLLGEKESPEVVEVVTKFIKERAPKNQAKNNHFPSMGEVKGGDMQDTLKKSIEALLPTKRIIKIYMKRFYKYVYPYFPYVDKKFFDERLFNNIFTTSNEDSPITVIIEEKFDFVLLAMFLIVMRLTCIALPPVSSLPDDEKILASYPVGPEFVSTALNALSLFKVMRKSKLTIVQTLLLFRLYCNFAPEDGDGGELTQSQILFGTIVQSAYTIGLNRDASRHQQMNFDNEYANLWRRLWLGILETDKFYSTIAGHIPIIQNLNSFEMRFPDDSTEETKLDAAINEEYRKSQRILKLYYDLSNMVNNLASPPKACDLTDVIRQMNVYVNINYSCSTLTNLAGLYGDEREAANYRNVKCLQHTFQTKALTVTVYHGIYIHYENTKYQNLVKLKEYQTHWLRVTIDLANLLYVFLTDGFKNFIDDNHKFFLLRYSENMLQRVITSFISLLTRLHHTLDLIGRGIGSQSLVVPLQTTINYTFRIASGLNILMQNTLGTKYYQAFKTSLRYKFYLRSLCRDGHKCIKDTISFLTQQFPEDPVARLSLLQRLDLKVKPEGLLQDIDTKNCLVNCLPSEIDHWRSMLLDCSILNDEILSSENAIWEPSFKTLPKSDMRGFEETSSVPMTPLTVNQLVNNDMAGSEIINLDEILNSIDAGGLLPSEYDDIWRDPSGNNDWLFRL